MALRPKELVQQVLAQLVALLPVPPGPSCPQGSRLREVPQTELPSGRFWG